jgi:hypothetical protein
MLYDKEIPAATSVNKAVSRAYSKIKAIPEAGKHRYLPRDISLELSEEESPLTLAKPFLSAAKKQYFYRKDKLGETEIEVFYHGKGNRQVFAAVTHQKLSTMHIFAKQIEPKPMVKLYERTIGQAAQTGLGRISHDVGTFKYVSARSNEFTCIFTVKYLNAMYSGNGGHEMIHGHFCEKSGREFGEKEATEFISSFRFSDKDPIKIREYQLKLSANTESKVYAIRIFGSSPFSDHNVRGLKLVSPHFSPPFVARR